MVRQDLETDLNASPELWKPYEKQDVRVQTWDRFKKYAYQWY